MVGLVMNKLGDGAVSNGVLTGVQPWWVGEGWGATGLAERQLNVGGYGAVRRRGGATHRLHSVAPRCTVAPNVLFTKVRHHGAH